MSSKQGRIHSNKQKSNSIALPTVRRIINLLQGHVENCISEDFRDSLYIL